MTMLISRIFPPLMTLVIGFLAVGIITRLLRSVLEKSKLEKAAHTLILSVCKVVMYALVILSVASSLGIDVTSVITLAGVLTLAVSLALQDLLSNILGGLSILYTHPFRSGDFVEISGQAGTVREINIAYTMLATPDNKLVSIPNKAVVGAQIINYSALGTRRVDISASASYEMPAQKVIDALVAAGTVEKALSDPAPCAMVMEYGPSTVNYALRVWCKCEDYWDVFFLVNQRVKEVFDEQGVAMSFPHLNVHLDK